MADLSGVRDFAAALAGGDAIEQGAYDASAQRLIRERGARALMEKRVAQAANARIEADAAANLINSMPPGRDRDILMSKLGTSFSGLQRGLGLEQKNTARGAAIDALISGEVDPDTMNMLIGIAGDKMLGVSNVSVDRQASARALKDEAAAALTQGKIDTLLPAQVSAEEALAGQRDASATKSLAPTSSAGGKLPSATTLAMLFPFNESGKQPGFEQFLRWQAEQAEIDPAYASFDFAHRAYLVGKKARAPGYEEPVSTDPANPPGPGVQQEPDRVPTRGEAALQQGVQADADALVAAAERAVANGADPKMVEARLRSELQRRGFTYGNQ